MDLPRVAHPPGGKATDGAVKWQLCYDMTAKTWWMELHFCTSLSSSMMQTGVCLRQDTETTLPELTEQHKIRQKEEELSGLESVRMAESETECAAPGLDTLKPESVPAHSGVNDVHHTHTALIKTEADLGPTNTGDLKTEHLKSTELGYATHLHPDQIKTETDDGGYIKAEHISDLQDIKCVDIKSDEIKFESSEILANNIMNAVRNGPGGDHKGQTEPCAGGPNPFDKKPGKEQYRSTQRVRYRNKPSKLIQNERIHTREKSYKCDLCGKCFVRKGNLNNHQGITPYTCTQCGKCFLRKNHLSNHQRIHTRERPHKCDQCGKCFTEASALCKHLRIHTGEKPYTCTQCGKSYCHKSYLRSHERIHKGEKPYKCNLCEKNFCLKSYLHKHEQIHTDEKRHKCTKCGNCFLRKSHLKDHQKIHTGKKPYKCNRCEKSFCLISYLRSHELIHTGEKPYTCTQCEKSFLHKSNLHKHQKIHTGKKPYKFNWQAV